MKILTTFTAWGCGNSYHCWCVLPFQKQNIMILCFIQLSYNVISSLIPSDRSKTTIYLPNIPQISLHSFPLPSKPLVTPLRFFQEFILQFPLNLNIPIILLSWLSPSLPTFSASLSFWSESFISGQSCVASSNLVYSRCSPAFSPLCLSSTVTYVFFGSSVSANCFAFKPCQINLSPARLSSLGFYCCGETLWSWQLLKRKAFNLGLA